MNRIIERLSAVLLKRADNGFVYFGHGICEQQKDSFIEQLHMTKDQFIRLIDFWQRLGVHFISMDDLLQIRKSDSSYPKPWIHFTFDDGYLNNLTTLLPIMEEYKIPFTIFASTGLIEEQEYMPSYYIRIAIMYTQKHYSNDACGIFLNENMDKKERQKIAVQLIQYYKYLSQYEGKKLLGEIKELLSPSEWKKYKAHYSNDRLLSVNNFRKLASHPLVTLGAHSHTHSIMHKNQEESTIIFELQKPLEWIKEKLQLHISSLSYPNGTEKDYSMFVWNQAEKLGYQLAFTTTEGFIHKDLNSLLLPRQFLHPKAGSLVKAWLKEML